MDSSARRYALPVVTALLALVALTEFDVVRNTAKAGDWPQILGPQRNGSAADESPLKAWPPQGPRSVWSYELGLGYGGPAVVGDRVIVFHRVGNVERIEAIDAQTGKSQWRADFPATYAGGVNSDTGPRCVPLIHDDHVYAFGAAGHLHCVKLADGQAVWSRNTYADFRGLEGYFGAGSTPIVADDKLLVNVGGRDAGLVAFDLRTGDTVWKRTDERASYSSPTQAVINGQQHVIFVTRRNAVSVNPRDGGERFRFRFGQSGATVNAATPLVFGDLLFVSAAYGVGAKLARISKRGAETVWSNDRVMSSQYSTCVHHQGFLYGTHGREDFANGELRCLEAKTGKQQWSVPGFGVAHVVLVGDQLVVLNTEAQLYLVAATPRGFRPLAKARVSDNTTRALPAFSRGRLYFRDSQPTGGRLTCLALGAQE